VIPRAALLDDGDESAVYTVRDGKAVRVPVELGYIDGNLIEVRSGLEDGAPVVTAGKIALREGSAVQVIGEAPVAAAKPAADAKGDAK